MVNYIICIKNDDLIKYQKFVNQRVRDYLLIKNSHMYCVSNWNFSRSTVSTFKICMHIQNASFPCLASDEQPATQSVLFECISKHRQASSSFLIKGKRKHLMVICISVFKSARCIKSEFPPHGLPDSTYRGNPE